MSLINDALKRAKAAQQQTPPPSPEHLHLRPVEPHAAVTHGLGLAMPAALALLAMLILFFVWRLYQDSRPGGSPPILVAANTGAPAPLSASAPTPSPVLPSQPQAAPVSPTNAAPEPGRPASEPGTVLTNAAAPEPPRPAPLKLQGITYSPSRPSAVINGKTVFLGDRIREFRVISIRLDGATLVGAGQTNVLTMGD